MLVGVWRNGIAWEVLLDGSSDRMFLPVGIQLGLMRVVADATD